MACGWQHQMNSVSQKWNNVKLGVGCAKEALGGDGRGKIGVDIVFYFICVWTSQE